MTASSLNCLGGLILVVPTLAARIKEAFGDRKPAEIARAVKKSKGAVTQWLDGTTKNLKADTAMAMEAATGYRASWLVSGKGPKKVSAPDQAQGEVFRAPTSEEWDLLESWRHLLASDKRDLLGKIEELAEEREAQRRELLQEAGLTGIMERAAHASRGSKKARTTVDPADTSLKQRALFEDKPPRT